MSELQIGLLACIFLLALCLVVIQYKKLNILEAVEDEKIKIEKTKLSVDIDKIVFSRSCDYFEKIALVLDGQDENTKNRELAKAMSEWSHLNHRPSIPFFYSN
jgi:hypothetical protein